MVATKTTSVSVDELWEMRHEPYRLDLIDGELYRMPGAGGTHGEITIKLGVHLQPFVAAHGLGSVFAETGFKLDPDRNTVLFPDVAFVRTKRLPPRTERDRFLHLAPDLAVEIVSPTDYPKLVADKVAAYLAAGTEQVWVIYPRSQTIKVHQKDRETIALGPNDTLTGDDLVPGFAVPVADLFPS